MATRPAQQVELVSIDTLTPHPANPRQGDVGALCESIAVNGWYGAVIVSRRPDADVIVAGEHRWRALRALQADGWTDQTGETHAYDTLKVAATVPAGQVPIIALTDLSADDERKVLLADNRTSDLAVYDETILTELLKELAEGSDLDGTAFSGDDLDDLIRDAAYGGVRTLRPSPVPIEMLSPHPRNYRVHPPDQLEHIVRSIELHGFYRNVVLARDGTILAGHGVVAAAREMGRKTVPAIRLDLDPFEPRALSILAADNEISNLAEVDDRALTELLRELGDDDMLLGTGFDAAQVASLAMVTRPASELADLDAAGEWLGLPGFEAQPKYPQIAIKFETEEDRDRFAKLIDMTIINKRTGNIWSIWWPEREREDLASIKYEPVDDEADDGDL